MAGKNRSPKLDLGIRQSRRAKHKVTVVLGTGDPDYKFPDIPRCIHNKLGCAKNRSKVENESPEAPGAPSTGESQHPCSCSTCAWKQALPMVQLTEPMKLPTIEVNGCLGCFGKTRLAEMTTDLMVVTVMEDSRLAGPFSALDKSLDGLLEESINQQGFSGKLGERFLLDITELERPQKYLLVVGLGQAREFGGSTTCSLIRLITDVARKTSSKSVLLTIPPRRLSEESVSLRGTGAILRCRLEERSLRGELGVLEKVELVCSPQARKYLQEGVELPGARCQTCTDPKLPLPCTHNTGD